jgi:hypothetical protein
MGKNSSGFQTPYVQVALSPVNSAKIPIFQSEKFPVFSLLKMELEIEG